MRKLVSSAYQDKFKSNIDKIYEDTYLDAYNDPKKNNHFDDRYGTLREKNPNNVMTLDIPGAEPLKAIIFGKGNSVRALFKIKDRPGAAAEDF